MVNDSRHLRQVIEMRKKQIRAVVVGALSDLLEATMTSARGVSAGGTLIEGHIPVVSSDLINSLVSGSGSGGAQGADSYSVAIAGMTLGDYLTFAWGMAYARRIEYGFTGTDAAGRTFQQPGWHFVGHNVARFPAMWEANKRLHAT